MQTEQILSLCPTICTLHLIQVCPCAPCRCRSHVDQGACARMPGIVTRAPQCAPSPRGPKFLEPRETLGVTWRALCELATFSPPFRPRPWPRSLSRSAHLRSKPSKHNPGQCSPKRLRPRSRYSKHNHSSSSSSNNHGRHNHSSSSSSSNHGRHNHSSSNNHGRHNRSSSNSRNRAGVPALSSSSLRLRHPPHRPQRVSADAASLR